ncbi:TonB-dependent siderophore receptor [filamentous cyanobacterium CCP1]|nr:TonB-dependent siderophore receptor [filamentous cyanobacterium CCP1]
MVSYLKSSALVISALSLCLSWAARADANSQQSQANRHTRSAQNNPLVGDRPDTSRLDQAATSIDEWMAQIEQQSVQVTDLHLNETDTGLSLVLETSAPIETPTTSILGNAVVIDIANAVLNLPDGDEFQSANPADDIALISAVSLPDGRVRVSITGVSAPPTVDVNSEAARLTVAIAPGTETATTPDDSIQVVVTGEQDGDYVVDEATTATRTDTPLRDIPQSIQVVPQQVLEDQQVIRVRDALRNVSGIGEGNGFGNARETYVIRGFFTNDVLRDGFLERSNFRTFREPVNLERIEILKGPASVLYGNLEPGGIINLVTELPLPEPRYEFQVQAGSFGTVRPSFDITGPLNDSRTVLYRVNGVYERSDGFRDYDTDIERVFVAPVVSWQISDRTDLILDLEYLRDERPFDRGVIALGGGIADIPFDRILGEPDDIAIVEEFGASLRLNHEFNDNWTLRNGLRFFTSDNAFRFARVGGLNEETGELTRSDWSDNQSTFWNYSIQSSLQGEFSTGSIDHTLLVGVDLFRVTDTFDNRSSLEPPPPINIFDPIYGRGDRPDRGDLLEGRFLFQDEIDNLGIYIQDQIEITDNLNLLVGGRFDVIDQDSTFNDVDSELQEEAFSPRIGIVYQPIQPISLYTSFSQSFTPNTGTTVDGDLLEPERGTQFEVGIRGESFDGRLTTNLAAYHLTKRNIAVTDPKNTDFSIAVGEQRSQGIELDVLGEILPGWNIIASYAHTDAEVTDDGGSDFEGNRLADVPRNAASLWTTYELQSGDLRGLEFGLGLFYASDRPGNLNNDYEIPSYLRTDARIGYTRDNWQLALNFINIFDVDYIQNGSFGRTANPGTPFTVLGSVSVEF